MVFGRTKIVSFLMGLLTCCKFFTLVDSNPLCNCESSEIDHLAIRNSDERKFVLRTEHGSVLTVLHDGHVVAKDDSRDMLSRHVGGIPWLSTCDPHVDLSVVGVTFELCLASHRHRKLMFDTHEGEKCVVHHNVRSTNRRFVAMYAKVLPSADSAVTTLIVHNQYEKTVLQVGQIRGPSQSGPLRQVEYRGNPDNVVHTKLTIDHLRNTQD